MEKKSLLSRWLAIRSIAAVSLILIFLSGFITGVYLQNRGNNLDLSQFWQVYQLIKSRSLAGVDQQKAAQEATRGLVKSLGDPYSSYLDTDELKALDDDLKGEFEGIGAELEEKDGQIVVIRPLPGSPAETAGVKSGDVVAKIDDTTTEDMTLATAVSKIRGAKDSQVKLGLIRSGEKSLIELSITRSNVQIASVEWKMINRVGYINVVQFGDSTVELFGQAIKEISAKNPSAVIVDLRSNPGGYLNAVPPLAGEFIAPSVITIERYRDGHKDEVRSTNVPRLPNTQLLVLVNGGSASAAEILAGALQDYKRATLVGEKTFGKGSVQDIIDLPKGAALRLTIAEWLTPNSRAINKVGITPDVVVEDKKTDDSDPVLDKALSLVK